MKRSNKSTAKNYTFSPASAESSSAHAGSSIQAASRRSASSQETRSAKQPAPMPQSDDNRLMNTLTIVLIIGIALIGYAFNAVLGL